MFFFLLPSLYVAKEKCWFFFQKSLAHLMLPPFSLSLTSQGISQREDSKEFTALYQNEKKSFTLIIQSEKKSLLIDVFTNFVSILFRDCVSSWER